MKRNSSTPQKNYFHAIMLACSTLTAGITLSGCAMQSSTTLAVSESVSISFGQDKTVNVKTILPDNYTADTTWPVVFTLPPGDGSGAMVDRNLELYWDTAPKIRGYVVIAPQVFGPDLADDAADMLPAIFAWMDENISYDAGRVILAGASNGGRGVILAALAEPTRFRAIIAMPGEFPSETEQLSTLATKPVWLLVGENDTTWREFADTLKASLDEAGAITELSIEADQGHIMTIDQDRLLDWIDTALQLD